MTDDRRRRGLVGLTVATALGLVSHVSFQGGSRVAAQGTSDATRRPADVDRAATPRDTGAGRATLDLHDGLAHVELVVQGLENRRGKVMCGVYRGPTGFPDEHRRTVAHARARLDRRDVRCVFPPLPPGRYAFAVIHDEDDDDELDTGLFGVPSEGWAVSRDAAPSTFGPPSFEDAVVTARAGRQVLRVTLRY